ncbi:MAG: hypothetical protein LBU89_04365 [Fibromonadaceae bacterium]|nr:hypothetical protein [Fibromonadaceae bacterium]
MFNPKYLLIFALGFVLATGIGIHRQRKTANKANEQIATAKTVISDLQNKQMELERLKNQFQQERYSFQRSNQLLQDKISALHNELSNQECSTQVPQPKRTDGVFILPSNFEITLGGSSYNCRAK